MIDRFLHAFVAILFLSMGMAHPAFSEATDACPETAEQALFNMTLRVRAGQASDASEVYNLANLALEKCPHRDEVQGLAVELFVQVAFAAQKPEEKLVVWSKAYEAAVNNHNAFDHGTSPVVKLPDGSDRTLYPYATVSELMKHRIIGNLLDLWLEDQTHPIFEDIQLPECPYNGQQGRVRDEVEGLRHSGDRLRPNGGNTVALRRLYHLKAVCLRQTSFINIMLAELHASTAKFAIIRKRRDAAIDHAEASLALYEEIKVMELTDSQDKPVQMGIAVRIREATDLIAKARETEQIELPQ